MIKGIEELGNIQLNQLANEMSEVLAQSHEPVRIVNAGLVKAGKSTLYNALVEEKEKFKTGPVRNTKENQELSIRDFILVDTPGINANKNDTDTAFKAYKQADVILFIHNILDGELERSEIDFLHQLQDILPGIEGFHERVLFVVTNVHQIEDEEDVRKITEKIGQQVKNELNWTPKKWFNVDSITHMTGVTEQKPLLAEISGLLTLWNQLQEWTPALRDNKINFSQRKLNQIQSEMIGILQAEQKQLAQASEGIREKLDGLDHFSGTIESEMKEVIQSIQNWSMQLQKNGKEKITPVHSLPDAYFSGSYSSGYTYSSYDSAERAGRDAFYEKITNKLNYYYFEKLFKGIMDAYRPYERFEISESNPYYKLQRETQLQLTKLSENVAKVTKHVQGISTKKIETSFSISVENTNKFDTHEVMSELQDIEAPSWYAQANIDTDYTTKYEKGWFGNEKEVDYYNYNYYDAKRDIENDLNRNIRNGAAVVSGFYQKTYETFLNRLSTKFKEESTKLLETVQAVQQTLQKERIRLTALIEKDHQQQSSIQSIISSIENTQIVKEAKV